MNVILDFNTTTENDIIDLSRTNVSSFEELTIERNGESTVIEGVNGTSITLTGGGISMNTLTADDFLF